MHRYFAGPAVHSSQLLALRSLPPTGCRGGGAEPRPPDVKAAGGKTLLESLSNTRRCALPKGEFVVGDFKRLQVDERVIDVPSDPLEVEVVEVLDAGPEMLRTWMEEFCPESLECAEDNLYGFLGENPKMYNDSCNSNAPLQLASREWQTRFGSGDAFQKMYETRIPGMAVNDISPELLASDWGSDTLLVKVYEEQGAFDLSFGEILRENDSVVLRELSLHLPLPRVPMCPRSVKSDITLRLEQQDEQLILETVGISPDAPFSSKFSVQMRIVFANCADGLKLELHGRIIFHESCGFLGGVIRRQSLSTMVFAGKALESLLISRSVAT